MMCGLNAIPGDVPPFLFFVKMIPITTRSITSCQIFYPPCHPKSALEQILIPPDEFHNGTNLQQKTGYVAWDNDSSRLVLRSGTNYKPRP
jgi:hypothetical protein